MKLPEWLLRLWWGDLPYTWHEYNDPWNGGMIMRRRTLAGLWEYNR